MRAVQPAHTYRNVMEPLVGEEVEGQLKQLSPKIASYINKTEVIAYALNRLPPLYATSEKGWQQQLTRARKTMRTQIVSAVRQAIAAIQRDPLRTTAPLKMDENRDANEALQGLRDLLQVENLSWNNLVDAVEHVLVRTARGEISWRKRGSSLTEGRAWRDSRYTL